MIFLGGLFLGDPPRRQVCFFLGELVILGGFYPGVVLSQDGSYWRVWFFQEGRGGSFLGILLGEWNLGNRTMAGSCDPMLQFHSLLLQRRLEWGFLQA
jgi:hypothetical protein